jgi:nucleotide-binding universal stress UspA family protein
VTAAAADGDRPHVLVGYDGSPDAANALAIGARLLPGSAAHVVHLWAPPFASADLRRRLLRAATSLDQLSALLEREGAAEAERIAAEGVALAHAAGWQAEPLAHRGYGDEGLELARVTEKLRPAAVVVGARGLSGARAVLGSVSDMVRHYSPAPVLIVPHPLLAEERQAAAAGPVVVGHDESDGARLALAAATSLFPGRKLIAVTVADEEVGGERIDTTAVETVLLDVGRPVRGSRAVADAVARFAAERKAALIVVGSRGRSVWREIMLGSVAMAVLRHAERPVLTVPAQTLSDPGPKRT